MTVYEQLIDCCQGRDGQILSAAEIKSMVKRRYGTDEDSVYPSDYCYNSWNRSLKSRMKPLFEKIGLREYRWLGPDYPYTGIITWRPKDGPMQIVGEWVDGRLNMYEEHPTSQQPEEADHEDDFLSDLASRGISVSIDNSTGTSSVFFPPIMSFPASQETDQTSEDSIQQDFEDYLRSLIGLLEALHNKYPITAIHFPGGAGGSPLTLPDWFIQWCKDRGIRIEIDYSNKRSNKSRSATAEDRDPGLSAREEQEAIPLSPKQLDRLYTEYMEVLNLEIEVFGCKPTETRHLIGRLGEFYCARLTGGQLARKVNQAGFDVTSPAGKRISVKTTAQASGFVALNPNTVNHVDELMVLRYKTGDFEIVYYGSMGSALSVCRLWKEKSLELDISKARRLPSKMLSVEGAN